MPNTDTKNRSPLLWFVWFLRVFLFGPYIAFFETCRLLWAGADEIVAQCYAARLQAARIRVPNPLLSRDEMRDLHLSYARNRRRPNWKAKLDRLERGWVLWIRLAAFVEAVVFVVVFSSSVFVFRLLAFRWAVEELQT